ncbi:MAG: hypothetical protein R3B72_13930 [Polyangiaceae bacterium]
MAPRSASPRCAALGCVALGWLTFATPAPAAQTPAAQPTASEPAREERSPKAENPCNTRDPGFGAYERWNHDIAFGQALIPEQALDAQGAFDLIIHFHGHEAARKAFVPVGRGIVFVGIDEGTGSVAYARRFHDPRAFGRLVASIRDQVAARTRRPEARLRHLALSSWSAGYGAVREILKEPAGLKIDGLILLDSLYAGRTEAGELRQQAVGPFLGFAERASQGRGFMFLTHSSIPTPDYASTAEVASWLVDQLGGTLRKGRRHDPLGLELERYFDQKNLHLRGYAGTDEKAHCAHLGMLGEVVRGHLWRRWRRGP